MARIQLGDIFEISTSKGKAYLHFAYKDKEIGELVRVLNGLHNERPASFEELAGSQEIFVVYFPISAANKRKLVEHVANVPLTNFIKPKYMRTEHYVRGEFHGWHIVNTDNWERQLVKELTPEQKQLSPWGAWNDTLLIENLEEDWSLENWG